MTIIILSFKNFLKGLKYIFTPLGVISVFLIIGLSIAIPNIMSAVTNMINGVAEIISHTNVDTQAAMQKIAGVVAGLDWSNPVVTIAQLSDAEYLKTLLFDTLHNMFPDAELQIQAIQTLVQDTVQTILIQITIVVIMIVIGFILGHILTRMFVKSEIRKRKFWKAIVFGLLDTVISVLVIYVTVRILASSMPLWADILLILVIFLAHSFFAMFEGWLIHARKRVPLKKVFKFSSFIFVFIADLIIIVLGIGTVLLINLMGFIVLTVLMALSILSISHAVISANGESYVYYVANEGWIKAELKKKKSAAEVANEIAQKEKEAEAS